jgi:hypothetical protein
MPSLVGEVKPSVPCRRFAACTSTLRFTWKLESAGKIDWQFLAQFRPSLTEVSHVAWRGAPLEMTDRTKGGSQRASSLRPRCFWEVDPETMTRIYLYLSIGRYSDWLRAGRSGDQIPVGVRFFTHVQTGHGAHPASCTGSFPGANWSGLGADHPPPSSAEVTKG